MSGEALNRWRKHIGKDLIDRINLRVDEKGEMDTDELEAFVEDVAEAYFVEYGIFDQPEVYVEWENGEPFIHVAWPEAMEH